MQGKWCLYWLPVLSVAGASSLTLLFLFQARNFIAGKNFIPDKILRAEPDSQGCYPGGLA
ncbi:Uncharacterised protein [Yersinia pseudotuberculosis]|nr:Uncharacterised protein [Yersinia pseudotuberculosis]SUP82013.1 Uncharacterised protein [Yersinia pseudotuberculosis]